MCRTLPLTRLRGFTGADSGRPAFAPIIITSSRHQDGILCQYEDATTNAKLVEIALRLAPVVAKLDFLGDPQ